MTEIKPGTFIEARTVQDGVALVFDDMTIVLTHTAWAAILYFLEG